MRFLAMICALALGLFLNLVPCFGTTAAAQSFATNQRVSTLVMTRATVGTTTAAAIASGSVAGTLIGWKVCADSANSNYLAVGLATDADTDGRRLGAGTCVECPYCSASSLKAIKVKGGAASQSYSVTQFKP